MTRAELLSELREVINDTVTPYGWSDARLLRMLSEGQDKFCEETGFFTDSTNYTVVTVAGTKVYAIDPRIIEIKEVWDGARRLNQYIQGMKPTNATDYTDAPNRAPLNWQADDATGFLTLFEPPTAGITLTLRVWRYARIAFSTAATELEIPQRLHLACVEWAAYKAYNDHDREKQDPVKAADHELEFKKYVREGQRAFDRINGASPRLVPSAQYIV